MGNVSIFLKIIYILYLSGEVKEKSRLACRPHRRSGSHVGLVEDGLCGGHGELNPEGQGQYCI